MSDEIDRQKVEAWFDPPVKIPRPILDSMAAGLATATARADALAVEVATLRAAMIQPTLTDLDDLILPTCLMCDRFGEHRDEIVHKRTCVLARPPADPAQRGADLLALADAMAEQIEELNGEYLGCDLAAQAYRRLRSGRVPEGGEGGTI